MFLNRFEPKESIVFFSIYLQSIYKAKVPPEFYMTETKLSACQQKGHHSFTFMCTM